MFREVMNNQKQYEYQHDPIYPSRTISPRSVSNCIVARPLATDSSSEFTTEVVDIDSATESERLMLLLFCWLILLEQPITNRNNAGVKILMSCGLPQ